MSNLRGRLFLKFSAGALLFVWVGAAVASAAPVRWGVKLGYSSGQLRAEEDEGEFQVDKFSLGGFCGGLLAEIPLTAFLSLQPELLYVHKGGRYKVVVPVGLPGVSVEVEESRGLTYLEVPVLLKLSLAVSKPLRLTFVTGPSVGLALGAELWSEVDIEVPGMSFTLKNQEDIRRDVNDVELSYIIGGLFDLSLAKGKIVVDQRFSFALRPNSYRVVVQASQFSQLGFPMAQDMVYELDMHNYTFMITVGYLF